jgi:SNF2 family DNA or RNA helicase
VRLRILLPPTLAGSIQRGAIPAKIEIEREDGTRAAPEKCETSDLANLPDAERSALFVLSQWCNGKLTSFLQLNLEQTAEILMILDQVSCFFPANDPDRPIQWTVKGLSGVSDLVGKPTPKMPPSKIRNIEPKKKARFETQIKPQAIAYNGPPIEVEGSTEYLRIILPSSEHPGYSQILKLLREWSFLRDRSHRHWWWLRDASKVLDFLASHQVEFEEDFGAQFTENFRKHTSRIEHATLSVSASESEGEIKIQSCILAGDTPLEIIENALATGKNHIKNGQKTYLLTKDLRKKVAQVQKQASGDAEAPLLAKSSHNISRFQSTTMEEFLTEADPRFKPPSQWKKRGLALRDLSTLKPPKPLDGLEKILRPYQAVGSSWMLHLFDHGLGGILADEMGLGKTLQTLSFLSSLKQREQYVRTSLVVCPASLIENWKREAERFCPSFSVYAHHGPNRTALPSFLGKHDLVITSYGTLVRDRSLFEDFSFLCVIGDEAQHLKNRRTQNAKATASLSSEGRMLLTGTPIENNLSDLLSLLEFLLPGANPTLPQGSRGEERLWYEQRILKQAAPYLLRRSKREVAPELPEKIEQILYLNLTDDQQKQYDQRRKLAEDELNQLADSGANEGTMRMKTLTQLLRLRQACCDPRLIEPDIESFRSCKINAFREILYNCLEGGHRILVFSQFVKMLQLLKQELEGNSLPYCYLDGSTKDRMAQVDRFQQDESVPVFLISLKAGGTGLNLTGADVIIHFDPWWNPAAEAQATDRAHRIGQEKKVTVYKFITVGTVEEKVLQLQEKKRKLLQNVFDESEAANLSLSLNEFRELI